MEFTKRDAINLSSRGLENVTIPEGYTSIEDFAFKGYHQIKKVTLPSTLDEIGKHAFDWCVYLKEVVIKNVFIIGNSAFENCWSLESIKLPDNVRRIEPEAFKSCSSLKSIKIPSNLKSINSDLFRGCSSLKEVILPCKLESIGNYAFADCISLKSIEFPSTLKVIEDHAFTNCNKLEKVSFTKLGWWYPLTIKSGAFANCSSLEEIDFPKAYVSFSDISCFEGCKNLQKVVFRDEFDNKKEIFENCPSLKEIIFDGDDSFFSFLGVKFKKITI